VYVAVLTPGSCATGGWGGIQQTVSIYRVDAAQPDAGAGFELSGGACVPSPPTAGWHISAVTAVADTAFAEGTLGQVTAGRYSMATVDFSDGAHYCGVYDGFYDSTLDVATSMLRSPDQTLHLFPNVAAASGFADSTCMTPATAVNGTCAADARFALQFDDCSSGATVYSVGPVLDAGFEQQFQPDGGYGCNPVAPGMMGTWHALGTLPPSALGQVVRYPVGAGRLQYLTYEADGQFRWRQSAAFDQQTGTPCAVSWVSGVTTRCLPTPGPNAALAFSDANCTQPLYIVYLASSCAAPSASATAWASDPCHGPKIVHIGPPYNGAVYEGSPGACGEVPPPAGGTVMYRGVDDIDQATYPELTAVVE
jgi:hypothetical protein